MHSIRESKCSGHHNTQSQLGRLHPSSSDGKMLLSSRYSRWALSELSEFTPRPSRFRRREGIRRHSPSSNRATSPRPPRGLLQPVQLVEGREQGLGGEGARTAGRLVQTCIPPMPPQVIQQMLSVLLWPLAHCQASIELAAVSASAGVVTDYAFSLTKVDSSLIPAGSVLSVQFSYPLASGSYTCQTVGGAWTGTSLACSISGFILTVGGGFPTATTVQSVFQMVLRSVTNPPAAITLSLTGELGTASTTVFSALTAQLAILPGTLDCSLTPQDLLVGASTSYSFGVTSHLPHVSLQVSIPSSWSQDPLGSRVISNTAFCSGTGVSSAVTCQNTVMGSLRFVDLSLFATAYAGSFSFRLGTFTNPPTLMPSDYLRLVSLSGAGDQVEQCAVQVTGLTAKQLLSVALSARTVQSSAGLTLSFTTQSTLMGQDSLRIQFPPEFGLGSISSVTLSAPNTVPLNYGVSGQVVSISNLVSNSLAYILPAPTVFALTLSPLEYPPSTKPTSPVTISTLRNSFRIDSSQSAPFVALPGALSSIVLTPSTSQINVQAAYTLQLTLAHALAAPASLVVILPSEIGGDTFTGPCSSSSVSATCSFAKPALTISFPGAVAGSQTLSFQTGPFLNAAVIGTYQLQVKSVSDGYTVDSGTAQVTFSPGVLTYSMVVLSSTTTCLETNYYSFAITNKNPLPANSYLAVTLPSSVQVPDPALVRCRLSASVIIPCSYSAGVVTVQGIALSGVAAGALASTPIQIQLVNPPSTRTSDSFQVATYSPSNKLVDRLTSGLTVTMLTGAPLALSFTSSSNTNAAASTFSLSFQLAVTTPSPAVLTLRWIAVPSTIVFGAGVAGVCSLGLTSSCSLTAASWPSSVSLSISNVNPPSLQPVALAVRVLSADSAFKYYESSVSVVNTAVKSLAATFSFSPLVMGQASVLSLTLSPSIPLQPADSIRITFPSDYPLATVPSCTNGVSFTVACSLLGRVLTVTAVAGSFPASLSFRVQLAAAPSSSPSSYLSIQTLSANFQMEGSYQTVRFIAGCAFPCRTCGAVTTECLSCYQDVSLALGLTLLQGSTCVSTCPDTFYQSGSSCLSCSAQCSNCASPTICLSCPSSAPILFNSACYSSCPPGTFPSSPCSTCPAQCSACTSSSTCTACALNYYLSASTCLSQCPPGQGYDSSSMCTACPSTCQLCTSSTACTSCKSGSVLDASRCLATCLTAGTFKEGGVCLSCQSPCLTCTDTARTCASCSSSGASPLLFSGQCLNSCPLQNYESGGNCLPCTPPCLLCSSSSVCQSCSSGSLHLSSCVPSCPAGYYSRGGICTLCVSPCVACRDQANCLSCISSKLLQLTSCLAACTAPYYVQSGTSCIACLPPCETCVTTATRCLTCTTGSLLHNNQCLASCPSSTFASGAQCSPCVSPCVDCAGTESSCRSCIVGLYLYLTSCATSCPYPQIAYRNVCTSCQTGCTLCSGSPSLCSSCQSGYLYNPSLSSCAQTCAAGYYKENGTCLPCNILCTACLSSKVCSSCSKGFSLSAGACISGCPAQYYLLNGECLVCSTLCLNCSSLAYCTSCQVGQFLSSGTCLSTCPAATPFAVEGRCLACEVPHCIDCSGLACTNCSQPWLLSAERCVGSCPIGSVLNGTTCQSDSVLGDSGTLAYFPVPFTLALLLLGALFVLSSRLHPETALLPASLAAVSLLFTPALLHCLLLLPRYPSASLPIALLAGCLAFALLLNLVFLAMHCCKYRSSHKATALALTVGALTTFPFVRVLKSRLFGLYFLEQQKIAPSLWLIPALLPFLAAALFALFLVVSSLPASWPFFASLELLVLGGLGAGLLAAEVAINREEDLRVLRVEQAESEYLRQLEIKSEPDNSERVVLQRKMSDPTFQPDGQDVPRMQPIQVPGAIEAGAFRREGRVLLGDLFVIEEEEEDPPFVRQLKLPTLTQIRAKRRQQQRLAQERQFQKNISFLPEDKPEDQDDRPAIELRPRLKRDASRHTSLNQSQEDSSSVALDRFARGVADTLQGYSFREQRARPRHKDSFDSESSRESGLPPLQSRRLAPSEGRYAVGKSLRQERGGLQYINDAEEGLQVEEWHDTHNTSSNRLEDGGGSRDMRPGEYLDFQEQARQTYSFTRAGGGLRRAGKRGKFNPKK